MTTAQEISAIFNDNERRFFVLNTGRHISDVCSQESVKRVCALRIGIIHEFADESAIVVALSEWYVRADGCEKWCRASDGCDCEVPAC